MLIPMKISDNHHSLKFSFFSSCFTLPLFFIY